MDAPKLEKMLLNNRSQCEQAFNQYKDTLGFNRLRSCDDRSLRGRQFVQFIAASIGIMFRKRMVAAEAKGFKSGYDSDAKLLRALGTIHSTTFEGGTYYTEVISKLAAAYKALEMPIPEDEPSTGTAAPQQATDEELNTVEDLVDLTKLSVDDIDDLLQ